jgi:hypothetical protein
MTTRPDRSEANDYFFGYIDQVPDGDICRILEGNGAATLSLLQRVPAARADHRYAPDKWSIREVVSHLNDTERLFVFRAMWFARGLEPALPSFDQDVALAGAYADERPWRQHIDEFRAVRAASLAFFKHLRDDVWTRRGVASGNPFSVRALAYITAGHVSHHTILLRERYL